MFRGDILYIIYMIPVCVGCIIPSEFQTDVYISSLFLAASQADGGCHLFL